MSDVSDREATAAEPARASGKRPVATHTFVGGGQWDELRTESEPIGAARKRWAYEIPLLVLTSRRTGA
jgi:hypothetical protein